MGKSLLPDIVRKTEQLQIKYNVPMSNVIADEDGVGGFLVDALQCKGFVNGSRALNDENYSNLKSQCSYKMAEKIMKRETGEQGTSTDAVGLASEEMEQVKQKDIDKDGKIAIIGKDVVKMNIGRSPDEWDSIMMRYWFELAPKFFTF